MAAKIVWESKHEYPEIDLNLIIPYLTAEINNYKEFLKNNSNYTATFLDIGDGIGITKHTTISDERL